MAPPDRESWLLQSYYPTGVARGWRRTGCMVMLIAPLVIIVVGLVVAVVMAVV